MQNKKLKNQCQFADEMAISYVRNLLTEGYDLLTLLDIVMHYYRHRLLSNKLFVIDGQDVIDGNLKTIPPEIRSLQDLVTHVETNEIDVDVIPVGRAEEEQILLAINPRKNWSIGEETGQEKYLRVYRHSNGSKPAPPTPK